MTELVNFIDGADFSKNKVAIKKLVETPITKEIQISLPKGLTMKEHCAPYSITVMLVQGDLEFNIDAEKHHLKVGDLISLDPKVMHSLHALEDSIVRLSLAKSDSIARVTDVID